MHPSFERGFSNDFPKLYSNFKLLLFFRIKFQREARIHLGYEILSSWSRGLNLVRETLAFPFDSLPKVRNHYEYKDKIFTVNSK